MKHIDLDVLKSEYPMVSTAVSAAIITDNFGLDQFIPYSGGGSFRAYDVIAQLALKFERLYPTMDAWSWEYHKTNYEDTLIEFIINETKLKVL